MLEKRATIWFLANSDDEDEPNEQPVGTGGVKRTRDNNGFQQPNKRMREETRVWYFSVFFLIRKQMCFC